eukprot:354728-Chlamydomonas_euryale.AAC.3
MRHNARKTREAHLRHNKLDDLAAQVAVPGQLQRRRNGRQHVLARSQHTRARQQQLRPVPPATATAGDAVSDPAQLRHETRARPERNDAAARCGHAALARGVVHECHLSQPRRQRRRGARCATACGTLPHRRAPQVAAQQVQPKRLNRCLPEYRRPSLQERGDRRRGHA